MGYVIADIYIDTKKKNYIYNKNIRSITSNGIEENIKHDLD